MLKIYLYQSWRPVAGRMPVRINSCWSGRKKEVCYYNTSEKNHLRFTTEWQERGDDKSRKIHEETEQRLFRLMLKLIWMMEETNCPEILFGMNKTWRSIQRKEYKYNEVCRKQHGNFLCLGNSMWLKLFTKKSYRIFFIYKHISTASVETPHPLKVKFLNT